MKTTFLTGFLLMCACTLAAQSQPNTKTISVEVTNSWIKDKSDAPVVLKIKDLQPGFRVRSAVVMNGSEEIPSQLDDLNGDLKADELAFVMDIPARSKKTLAVTLSSAQTDKTYPARVFAEMLIRDAKKQKHAPTQSVTVPGTTNFYNMLHGHGPMFESELVAYRVYFNQKQTVDPYGKFKKGLEIKESGFYPNDEQLARGFGDDVLMVGNSCGVGALKGWDGTKATHIEPIAFRTEHRDLLVETFFDEPLENEVFCTGVQNIMGNETCSESDHKGLIGSWGRHWPVNDTVKYAKETVGIATYVPQKYIRQEVKDKDNFLYTLSAPGSDRFHHYTMFTSCKETFGYPTAEAWFAYMREWKEELQHPVQIKIKN